VKDRLTKEINYWDHRAATLKDQELAVPMNLVEETTRFSFKEIQRAAGEEMVNLRGTLIRLLNLNDLLAERLAPLRQRLFRARGGGRFLARPRGSQDSREEKERQCGPGPDGNAIPC